MSLLGRIWGGIKYAFTPWEMKSRKYNEEHHHAPPSDDVDLGTGLGTDKGLSISSPMSLMGNIRNQ